MKIILELFSNFGIRRRVEMTHQTDKSVFWSNCKVNRFERKTPKTIRSIIEVSNISVPQFEDCAIMIELKM